MIEILESKTVKIRKPCKCWGCQREFQPGVKLKKITSVDNGEFCHAAWCDVCLEIIASFDPIDRDLGFTEGEIKDSEPEFWESIREEVECQQKEI